jgi:serine/threonine protein phosphatase PrpC
VIEAVWETFRRDRGSFQTIHEFCGKAVENIMKLAFHKKTLDNITVVLVAFEGLEAYFQTQNELKPVDPNTEVRKSKGISKLESSFERKYVGRSVSPSNYNSLRTKSYYRPS